ncbi:RNA-directed DNA polymerase, eukaryota, reverse transcriptase zinc-binding domain protein [Tanacetum coccineum]
MDYFYKHCHKFHRDPIIKDDDEGDVDSDVEGIVVDMKPEVDVNVVDNMEINTAENEDVSNEDNYSFCGLLETHVKKKNLSRVCNRVLGNWDWVSNFYSCASGTRIIVGWDPNRVNVFILDQTPQVIHCFIEPSNGDPGFYCSFVYAFVHAVDRRCMCKYLINHKGVVKDRPWTILGDFNACLDPSERSCGGSKFTTAMSDFRDCVEDIEVKDISMTGLRFTWNKKLGEDGGLLKKLDRVLGNISFMSSFPSSYAHFLPYMLSDHSPAVLVIPKIGNVKAKPFKFHNYLTAKDDFIPVVKRVWSNKVEGFAMFSLVSKLKLLKKPLRKLNYDQGNLFENVRNLKAKLAVVQSSMNEDPHNNVLRDEELRDLKAYKSALKDEESFLRQKSKVEWLKMGDRNSKYFHNVVKGRSNRNRISYVEDMEVLPINDLASLFLKKLSDVDALYMVRNVSDDEIKRALFDIDGNKAPGPDGFCPNSSKILGLLLVVKSTELLKISFQMISDNILLSQELMRNYHRKRGPAKCAFKIDIEKAYYSMEWEFLSSCVKYFGFHEKMIKWVMSCVSSTSFTINVNGAHIGFFKGMRGLRQGDPLSPYLFTLIMEVLNFILKREIDRSSSFRYHWQCKEVKLTHLCFADDLLMFCNGDSAYVAVLNKALMEFGGMSGLLPNIAKSKVFFGNVTEVTRLRILNIIPFHEGSLPVRYLGVPLISKRLYIKDCLLLIDKASKRIIDWKNNSLSFAGRLQLIMSVFISMQVFWASMFILLVSISNEIERLLRYFLWNFGIFKRGKAKINWKSVCKPNVEGGLGIKALDSWNIALMSKHAWNIVADIIKNGEWDWPIELSQMFDALAIIPPPGLVDGMSDKIFWKSNKGRLLNFSVSSVWDDIRCGRLNTHDDMAHWDWNENFRCIFLCMVRLDYAPNSWHDIVEYILKRPLNKSIWSILQRLVLGSTVYMVWQERNLRTFQNRHRSMEELCNLFKDVVRLRIMGLSLKASSQVFVAADIWKFHVNMVTGSKRVNFTPWKKQV